MAERIVTCPGCRGPSVYEPGNRWRPFCSERCRQIDLGAWASEGYRVPQRGSAEEDADGDVTHDASNTGAPSGDPSKPWRH